ncbi:MAG: hypothetical protein N3F63_06565 [Thermoplasmata archaeon]|nr:hypothetical protein [Thermoplasmata archaeon]
MPKASAGSDDADTRGCYGNDNAKPDHFAKWAGHLPDADVNADIVYFSGHGATLNGQPRVVFNVNASGGDRDKDVEPDEDFWGYNEYGMGYFLCLRSSGTQRPDSNFQLGR